MAGVGGTGEFTRLEDFIRLSKQGKDVQITIDLRKLTIKQKVHPQETEESTGEIDSYLLVGDYNCRAGGQAWKIAKVYVMGSMEESLDTVNMNRNIANDRLKMDYRRLKDARIKIEEQFF
ncbi:conserved hypothetical protein [Syntrophobacter sp. SbD1]|nr:conserved hypothetical protein [Syntrophobacter sp. SbD1]